MKSIFKLAAAAILLAGSTVQAAFAEVSEEPIITFHTEIYKNIGPTNSFTLYIGGTKADYIDVDLGKGPEEYELNDCSAALNPTEITCTTDENGIVKIYGDPSLINYFSASGCYIKSIDISKLTNLEFLWLDHNSLEALDLSAFSKLTALYVSDNPYSAENPLKVGGNKPKLRILEIGMSDHLDQSFNLSDYPNLEVFDAYAARDLRKLDPSGCPKLLKLSADVTLLEELDVTKNANLSILNISETRITDIDLSGNPVLQQFFATSSGAYSDYSFEKFDFSHNPKLAYLYISDNKLTELDVTQNPELTILHVSRNYLTGLDLSKNENLINVNIRKNCMGFASMPAPPADGWNTFLYDQRDTPVNRSYKVGDAIDFSELMIRNDGSETNATLYQINEDNPSSPFVVDPSTYTYENGVIKFLDVQPDSVFVTFQNSLLDLYTISTTKFMVKSEAEFGKDLAAVAFTPAANAGEAVTFTVGISGASEANPKTFSVDFGNGTPVEFTAKGATIADGCLVSGNRIGSGYVTIYTPENIDLTALAIKDQTLYSLDISKADHLTELALEGTGLYSIELDRHRNLQTIKMTGNHFYSFSIKGKNNDFNKTMLSTLIMSNNGISEFTFDGLEGLSHIDFSNNNLKEFNFASATSASYINVSNNQLTEADLSACDGLKDVVLSNNSITSLTLPEESTLSSLAIGGNAMTLANLPEPTFSSYSYAPQAKLGIPVKGPGADLSSQYRVIDGQATVYTWYKENGDALVEGTDYTISEGKTKFINTELGTVYCVVSHPAYPDFTGENALCSTPTVVAAMPNNVIASFVTPVAGQNVALSLAATEANTTIFIDWKGDGIELESYDLGKTYRLFNATTYADAEVKVYSYEDGAPLFVFSISGATMSSVDLSKLTSAATITLSGASLSEVALPEGTALTELDLSGNNLSTIDLSKHNNLYSLALQSNNLAGEFDLSELKNLQAVSLANNKLTSVKLNNKQLFFLDLTGNELESIDLSGAPGLNQLGLGNNKFESVDVSMLSNLHALYVDKNRFTFATLPEVKEQYNLYIYANQAALNVVPEGRTLDLSSQAAVGDSITTYTWFIDEPTYNEDLLDWEGETLYDDEYSVENGVVTFKNDFIHLVGLLRNGAFPDLDLFTEMMNISGVENVAVSTDAATIATRTNSIVITSDGTLGDAKVYSVSGKLVRTAATVAGETLIPSLESGLYIVTIGNQAAKVAIR